MWGIYRGRRLVLYVIAAIVIATLIGYSTYTFVKLFFLRRTFIYTTR